MPLMLQKTSQVTWTELGGQTTTGFGTAIYEERLCRKAKRSLQKEDCTTRASIATDKNMGSSMSNGKFGLKIWAISLSELGSCTSRMQECNCMAAQCTHVAGKKASDLRNTAFPVMHIACAEPWGSRTTLWQIASHHTAKGYCMRTECKRWTDRQTNRVEENSCS